MGGLRDSSLTRVQPAFDQLSGKDGIWLQDLCRLGSRSHELGLPTQSAPWLRVAAPLYEYLCVAPIDYLEWLLRNSHRPDLIAHEKISTSTGEVRQKREALFAGEQDVLAEGLERLHAGGRSTKGSWQVFEETTKVDCAVFSNDVTVFIEGKRTEPHLTGSTQWHRQRNQVARNLDCLRVDPNRADNWFVLLIVEKGTSAWLEATHLDNDRETFLRSLPHLLASEVDDVRDHYLGFTTWQDVQDAFGLQPYPDVSDHAQRRRSRKCPECGTTGLPIFYGLPSFNPYGLAAERGLMVLGGDVIVEGMLTWSCPNCEVKWDGPNPDKRIREIARRISADTPTSLELG